MRSILEETAIDLQHINVKLLLKDGVDLDPIIPIFHSWIQNQVFNSEELPELLIDVADYRHVHHGPGIVLIGHEADYSIDNTDGRLGLRYNRKGMVEGSNQKRLTQAFKAALVAAQRLQSDTRLNEKFYFNAQDVEFFASDRLAAPNTDETRSAIDPEVRKFAQQLFGGAKFSLNYQADPRRLFGAILHSERQFSIEELLQNLAL